MHTSIEGTITKVGEPQKRKKKRGHFWALDIDTTRGRIVIAGTKKDRRLNRQQYQIGDLIKAVGYHNENRKFGPALFVWPDDNYTIIQRLQRQQVAIHTASIWERAQNLNNDQWLILQKHNGQVKKTVDKYRNGDPSLTKSQKRHIEQSLVVLKLV